MDSEHIKLRRPLRLRGLYEIKQGVKKMILSVDIGNTSIVLACVDDYGIIARGREPSRDMSPEELCAVADKFLADNGFSPKDAECVVTSSVVPSLESAAEKAFRRRGLLRLAPDADHGIELSVDRPDEVGQDLIAGALGALSMVKPPVIIADMGTATTITAVDEKRRYLGGVILAGARMSADALHEKTARLPSVSDFGSPRTVFGKTTAARISAGIIYSNAAIIDGICARMEEELGKSCAVIATGGLSKQVTPYCKREIIYDPDLITKGLWAFYKRNRRSLK